MCCQWNAFRHDVQNVDYACSCAHNHKVSLAAAAARAKGADQNAMEKKKLGGPTALVLGEQTVFATGLCPEIIVSVTTTARRADLL